MKWKTQQGWTYRTQLVGIRQLIAALVEPGVDGPLLLLAGLIHDEG